MMLSAMLLDFGWVYLFLWIVEVCALTMTVSQAKKDGDWPSDVRVPTFLIALLWAIVLPLTRASIGDMISKLRTGRKTIRHQ